jgi:hypothetical protein
LSRNANTALGVALNSQLAGSQEIFETFFSEWARAYASGACNMRVGARIFASGFGVSLTVENKLGTKRLSRQIGRLFDPGRPTPVAAE